MIVCNNSLNGKHIQLFLDFFLAETGHSVQVLQGIFLKIPSQKLNVKVTMIVFTALYCCRSLQQNTRDITGRVFLMSHESKFVKN